MTTRRPDDASDLRDPRFDATWRALSRDEPPAALDDAIRAAARRGAHAGPRPVGVPAAHVPSALRPQRWWWPLAAAATIGAVAIGLLQLATPEHVGAPTADKGVVSDIPIVPEQARRKAEAAREELPPADAAKVFKQATDESAVRHPQPSAPAAPRTQSSATPSPPAASMQRKDAASPVAPSARVPGTPTFAAAPPPASSPPAEKPSSAAEQKTRQAAANAAAPAPAAEPFPADAAKRGAKETASSAPTPSKTESEGGSAGALSGRLVEAPAPAQQGQTQAGAPAPAAPLPAPRAKTLGGAVAQDSLTTAPATAAGTVASTAPRSALEPSSTPERAASARGATREAQLAKSSIAQSVDAQSELGAKHPPLPVADWITLIRKLRDDGKPDDAAKELAAFRTAYSDHERLLPPDLRDWHPPPR